MKNKYFLVFFIALTYIIPSCNEEENTAPTCVILNPENNEYLERGDIVEITIAVDDAENNIHEVIFYINDARVMSLRNSPYSYSWHTDTVLVGSYSIKTVAVDEKGKQAQDEITINIINTITDCGTVTDIDGNTYTTVQIGEQCWIGENLKVTHYPDNTQIPEIQFITDWDELRDNDTDDAFCFYNNNQNSEADTYGALYTWSAATKSFDNRNSNKSVNIQGVCPDGWHIPSDNEWQELELALGLSDEELVLLGFRGEKEGSILAGNAPLWMNGILEIKPEFSYSGFIALPAGERNNYGAFNKINEATTFWTSTENDGTSAWSRKIEYNNAGINRFFPKKSNGFSVRCVKD